MQRKKILNDKLKFAAWFFDLTTEPFAEIKRKIEAGEHPDESDGISEDTSEPPFLLEWLDAHRALQLQGQLCLNLLQRSLLEYLDETVKLGSEKAPSKKGNWFENYMQWFLDRGVDWNASGSSLSLIEEMTLARNCIQHGSSGDAHSLIKQQGDYYHTRFPNAVLQSEFEARIFSTFGPQLRTIELTKGKLVTTTEEIVKFSNFIEESLPDSMKCWQT